MSPKRYYSDEPHDRQIFTERFDRFYSRFARAYDWFVKTFAFWPNWLNHVIPHLQGNRVLEVSFGTGYLLTQYAGRFMTCGIDLNEAMAQIAKENVAGQSVRAHLQVATVETLPYADDSFDTLVNTMSFTGYPDAQLALSEMHRVLRKGGRLIMIDINYPLDGNWIGSMLTRAWQVGGDIIRDMDQLFHQYNFQQSDIEIGGAGSVHLYIATKL